MEYKKKKVSQSLWYTVQWNFIYELADQLIFFSSQSIMTWQGKSFRSWSSQIIQEEK